MLLNVNVKFFVGPNRLCTYDCSECNSEVHSCKLGVLLISAAKLKLPLRVAHGYLMLLQSIIQTCDVTSEYYDAAVDAWPDCNGVH